MKNIYNQYRPKLFSEVVGQEHTIRLMQNSIVNGMYFHAYIICGPRGVGKTTLARIFASALNCEKFNTEKNGEMCFNCFSCLNSIDHGIVEIDASSNRGINEMKLVMDDLKYAHLTLRKRILIIDEAHMLTNDAFSAMLKFIEEPPRHVVIMLLTTELEKIIPTIRSRCNVLELVKIQDEMIKKQLKNILISEKRTVDDSILNYIARSSNGILRDALVGLQNFMILDFKPEPKLYNFETNENFVMLYNSILQSNFDIVYELEKFYLEGFNIHRFFMSFLTFLHENKMPKSHLINKIFFSTIYRLNSYIEEKSFWMYMLHNLIEEVKNENRE